METKEVVDLLVKELDEKKAENIVAIDVSERTPFAEYYILATAGNSRHLNALKELAIEKLEEANWVVNHAEGTPQSGWMLVDGQSIIVNIFTKEQRARFDLDKLLTTNK